MEKIVNKQYDLILDRYEEMEYDIDEETFIAEEQVLENFKNITKLNEALDFISSLDKNDGDFTKTLVDVEDYCKELNISSLFLVQHVGYIEVNNKLDQIAQDASIFDSSYYNKDNLFTRLTTLTKYLSKNLLENSLVNTIGGGKKLELDHNTLKSSIFSLYESNSRVLNNLRSEVNKIETKDLLGLLLSITSINILLNFNIEKL